VRRSKKQKKIVRWSMGWQKSDSEEISGTNCRTEHKRGLRSEERRLPRKSPAACCCLTWPLIPLPGSPLAGAGARVQANAK
jgi:hypothetical protein